MQEDRMYQYKGLRLECEQQEKIISMKEWTLKVEVLWKKKN